MFYQGIDPQIVTDLGELLYLKKKHIIISRPLNILGALCQPAQEREHLYTKTRLNILPCSRPIKTDIMGRFKGMISLTHMSR